MKTVVVLGFHRSGTSLIANICHNVIGVNMGIDFLPAKDGNKKGFWENSEFVRLNDEILQRAGGDWFNPPSDENILKTGYLMRKKIKKTININQSDIWGWKDPRTCLTINCYLPYIKNDVYIIRSMRERDQTWYSFRNRRRKAKREIERNVTRGHFEYLLNRYSHTSVRVKSPSISMGINDIIAGKFKLEQLYDFLNIKITKDELKHKYYKLKQIIDPSIKRY